MSSLNLRMNDCSFLAVSIIFRYVTFIKIFNYPGNGGLQNSLKHTIESQGNIIGACNIPQKVLCQAAVNMFSFL